MLSRLRRHIQKPQSECLYYWGPAQGRNFGDELSWHVVQRAMQRVGVDSARLERCEPQRRCRKRMLAVGSILHFARPGDIVWGSGINGKVPADRYAFSELDFRAVRGPLTRRLVIENGGDCPEVFGDPGLLVPLLFPELAHDDVDEKRYEVSFVPNLNDQALLDGREPEGYRVISPQNDWQQVYRDIANSAFVVSSSLHGIVFADALGVPCRPLLSMFEAPFKYEDYLLASNRPGVRFARSVSEAMDLGPMPEPQIDLEPLLQAFPDDLFASAG